MLTILVNKVKKFKGQSGKNGCIWQRYYHFVYICGYSYKSRGVNGQWIKDMNK